jgi:hypothetical protein
MGFLIFVLGFEERVELRKFGRIIDCFGNNGS